MSYIESFDDFIIKENIKSLINIDEYKDIFENLDEIEIDEAVGAGVGTIAGVFFVALFAAGLLQQHLRILKAKNDLKKKISEESDEDKKKKLQEDFDKLTKGEKALKGEILKTEEKLKKSKGKLDKKQTEKAKKKVLKYQMEMEYLKKYQEKIDNIKKN